MSDLLLEQTTTKDRMQALYNWEGGLTAVSSVKEFYPYLYGLSFKLITDPNPLTSLKGLKDVGGCFTRWMIFLQQFDFEMEYRPRKNHANAHAMSRKSSTKQVLEVIQELNTDMDALKES